MRSSKTSSNTDIQDKGLFSFFGDRKIKPLDETTVPGINNGNNNGNGNGNIGDVDGSNNGNNNGTDNNGGLSIRPVGSGQGGSTGSDGGVSGGGTGGFNPGGGVIIDTTGGTGGTGFNPDGAPINPVTQLNCTPKQIEFTEDELKKLKALETRFYKIAAEIKTQQDVETLTRTRQNYYDYLSSDYSATSRKDGSGVIELTKQCFIERRGVVIANSKKDTSNPLYGKPLGLRPNPFITSSVFKTLTNSGVLRTFLETEKKILSDQIKPFNDKIAEEQKKLKAVEDLEAVYAKSTNGGGTNVLDPNWWTLYDTAVEVAHESNSKIALLKIEKAKIEALLNSVNNDPFSYFTNNVTYVEKEEPYDIEIEQSRKNGVYLTVRKAFDSAFGKGDIISKMWGGDNSSYEDDYNKAHSNPLKDAGFGKPCKYDSSSKTKEWDSELGMFRCYEQTYPMQTLERVLGIW